MELKKVEDLLKLYSEGIRDFSGLELEEDPEGFVGAAAGAGRREVGDGRLHLRLDAIGMRQRRPDAEPHSKPSSPIRGVRRVRLAPGNIRPNIDG